MTHPNREELAGRLEELAALEPGWYANVGKRTGERCCQAMREAAAALRQSPTVEEVAALIRRHVTGSTVRCDGHLLPGLGVNGADKAAQAIDALYKRGGGS